MKSIAVYILIFFISVSILYSQDCTSTLQINSNRINAAIYIDDQLIGKGNIEVNLSVGEYLIEVKESERRWDAQYFIDTVKIRDCGTSNQLTYNFKDEIYLDSYPQDAVVIKNDIAIGYTPLILLQQKGVFELSKSNCTSKTLKLEEVSSVEPVHLDFTVKNKNTNFAESPWFKVLLGSAAVLGATAAHFKIQADKKYNQYLDTNDRQYLDETNKYDLYSGLAFGALQVNFGILIYILFTD